MLSIKTPWRRKPEKVSVCIDWSNPITRGLIHYCIYNKGASIPRDLAINLNGESVTGLGWGANKNGRMYSTDSATTTSQIVFGVRYQYDISSTPFTAFWVGNVKSFVGASNFIGQRTSFASGAWSLYSDAPATRILKLAIHNGSFYTVSTSYALPASGYMAVMVRGDAAGNYTFDIVDATGHTQVSASNASATLAAPGSHKLVVNTLQYDIADQRVRGEVTATGILRQRLTDSSALSVLKNPYQFLEPRTSFLSVVEAVGGVTGKSNPMAGPLGGPLAGPIG